MPNFADNEAIFRAVTGGGPVLDARIHRLEDRIDALAAQVRDLEEKDLQREHRVAIADHAICGTTVSLDSDGNTVVCDQPRGHYPRTPHARVAPPAPAPALTYLDQPLASVLGDIIDRLSAVEVELPTLATEGMFARLLQRIENLEPLPDAPDLRDKPRVDQMWAKVPDAYYTEHPDSIFRAGAAAQQRLIVSKLANIPIGTWLPIVAGAKASDAAKVLIRWLIRYIETGALDNG